MSGSKSVRISTNNFTLEEVELLANMIKVNFGLDCTIQKLSQAKGTITIKINIQFTLKSPLCQD
jgi:hypothetical protein